VVVQTEIGTIGLTICYDLGFPEYVRGLVLMGAQIIFNSSFFKKSSSALPTEWERPQWRGKAIAAVRACENGVGVAMSMRSGYEGDTLGLGRSCIASPWGSILASLGEGEGVTTAEIPLERLVEWRKQFPILEDRRVELYRRMLGY
jgi:predicted amidohydrolase